MIHNDFYSKQPENEGEEPQTWKILYLLNFLPLTLPQVRLKSTNIDKNFFGEKKWEYQVPSSLPLGDVPVIYW